MECLDDFLETEEHLVNDFFVKKYYKNITKFCGLIKSRGCDGCKYRALCNKISEFDCNKNDDIFQAIKKDYPEYLI